MTNQRIAPTGKLPLIKSSAEPPNYETPLEYFCSAAAWIKKQARRYC